ncbi:MAG: hypothetical protein Ct9H300mP14_05540 [Gammaproteobacteria bacterium]|nr:MAG: hypothetical protein Ct9H300mP14_05540 [Gammaproteobacteria bacterium]
MRDSKIFWEAHDPTEGCGRETTSVRSTGQASTPLIRNRREKLKVREDLMRKLSEAGFDPITTEILPLPSFTMLRTITNSTQQKTRLVLRLGGTG